MEYIDKIGSKYKDKAHQIIEATVQAQWIDGQYVNLRYADLPKSEIETILVDEQKHLCCYCMRRLRIKAETIENKVNGVCLHQNVTLEHVIPNKIKKEQYDEYREHYAQFENLNDSNITVFPGGELKDKGKKLQMPPYPHFFAYENLVASCDGDSDENGGIVNKHCCNEARGADYIYPFFFNRNVKSLVSYGKDGTIICDEPNVDYFRIQLRLMTSSFNNIRRFWYLIEESEYDMNNVDDARADKDLRRDIIDDIDDANTMEWEHYMSDDIWNLMADYSWFYSYYKQKYHSYEKA